MQLFAGTWFLEFLNGLIILPFELRLIASARDSRRGNIHCENSTRVSMRRDDDTTTTTITRYGHDHERVSLDEIGNMPERLSVLVFIH